MGVNLRKGRLLRALALVAGMTACFGASQAIAGPPFATDDPETLDPRHWEINAGVDYQNTGKSEAAGRAPFVEFNYGAATNFQVSLAVPMEYDNTPGTHHYAYGATGIGTKFRFIQESDHRPQVTFAPSVEIPSDAGSHAVTFLPIWLQKGWGPWTLYGGGGLFLNPGTDNRNYTFVGSVLTRDVSPATTVGVEFYNQSADTVGGANTTGANLGLTSQIGQYHALLFSIGRGLSGGNNAFSGYLAYRFMLGPQEEKK
jgi:hypothetical protein